MDPATFFGRSRVTRQTLKPKQETSRNVNSAKNVISEVNVISQKSGSKPILRERRKKDVVASKENISEEILPSKRATKNTRKTVKKDDGKDGKKHHKKECEVPVKSRNVHFAETEEELPDEPISSCPVYRNVRRSDVIGDPVAEYDFIPDENSSVPPKKRKPRKAVVKKNKWFGSFKWDASKKPFLGESSGTKSSKVQSKKPCKSMTTGTASKHIEPVPSDIPKTRKLSTPTKTGGQAKSMSTAPSTKPQISIHEAKETGLNRCVVPVRDSAGLVNNENHFTSTPKASPEMHKALALSGSKFQRKLSNITCEGKKNKQFGNGVNVNSRLTASQAKFEAASTTPPVLSPTVACVSGKPRNVMMNVALSSPTSASSNNCQQSTSKLTCSMPTSSFLLRGLCVRESPSFIEPEPIPDTPVNSSQGTPCSKRLDWNTITSTPLTRSKSASDTRILERTPTVRFAATSTSPSQDTSSPVSMSETPVRLSLSQGNDDFDKDLSGLFDDLPRTSVIPTRIFATHRGTIYVPGAENNITERRLPTLGNKEPSGLKQATVKSSDLLASCGLDECFGFEEEEEEDSTFVPQPPVKHSQIQTAHAQATQNQVLKRPNYSVQQVLALLRGQLKFASPANVTPRSVQTKLTDFVSSTPTSTPSRPLQETNSVAFTPTPVPLFGEEDLNPALPSPFNQPSRRSYDRLRPVKRIAYGDEVLSDDEDRDEITVAPKMTELKTNETKKKSRSYKKRKKPEDAKLDDWANQLSLHFNEVEDVELEVE